MDNLEENVKMICNTFYETYKIFINISLNLTSNLLSFCRKKNIKKIEICYSSRFQYYSWYDCLHRTVQCSLTTKDFNIDKSKCFSVQLDISII